MRTYSANAIQFASRNVSTEYVTHPMNVFAIQIIWKTWLDFVYQLVQRAVITVYVEVKRVSVMLVMRWIKVVNCACQHVIQDVEKEIVPHQILAHAIEAMNWVRTEHVYQNAQMDVNTVNALRQKNVIAVQVLFCKIQFVRRFVQKAVWMVYVQHQINVHAVKDGLLTKAARDAKQDVINLVWMVNVVIQINVTAILAIDPIQAIHSDALRTVKVVVWMAYAVVQDCAFVTSVMWKIVR